MDPVTHALIGLGISKLAGQPMSLENPAFVGTVIGAVAPDLDIVLQKWGDYVYLKNHRGMSHSVIGLIAFAALITVVLAPFYQGFNFLDVFLWSFLGCLSHSGIDMLNSYGVKFLWPLYDRKISFGLFIIFDPVVFGLLCGIAFSNRGIAFQLLGLLISYILLRSAMLFNIRRRVKVFFGVDKQKVNIMPSMIGLLKWHFIVEKPQSKVVGEKSIFGKKIKILEELKEMEHQSTDKVMNTPVAKFFAEFTPFYHVVWDDTKRIFKFIDIRYYIRNTFLHHATVQLDHDYEIVDQKFHPYSINRSVDIPL